VRHARAGKKLGRDSAHRKALYSNLAGALIEHGRIKTTVTKAKAVKPHVEHMITLGRRGDLHARRQATAFLRSRDVVHKLFADVAPLFKDRPGGYTRIIKIGTRPGDSAEMAYIELVDDEYVATQREERTPEPVAEQPVAEQPVAEQPVVVPEIPVEAAEELPETEEELVEDPEAAAEVLATEEAPADDAGAEPAAEAEEPAAEAEGDEPKAADEPKS
jgi:large subunit ribosomal protein L17